MRTFILTLILLLSGHASSAQSLYFIRARAGYDYEYREGLPPVLIIAYNPASDTVLQTRKDYTVLLNANFDRFASIVYYPRFRAFSFQTLGKRFYLLRTSRPDTLVELVQRCPDGYKPTTGELGIIDDHWVYSCKNYDLPRADRDRFKGLDRSLTRYFDLKATEYKDLYITGIGPMVQRVELKPNDSNMYLPIVADIENRPPFSVVLPGKYRVDKRSYTAIYVNDEQKTLVYVKSVNPREGEEHGYFHAALYLKERDTWREVVLKGNSPVIMTYGRWLAGSVQDKSNPETGFYVGKKVSPGKAARDSVYMEYTFDEQAFTDRFYRPGILYLYDTGTGNYIEWSTGQGDSEILLVEDETVYYRVFNAIYKAPILDGKRLGKPVLLVRDNEHVPFIHWAFLQKDEEEP